MKMAHKDRIVSDYEKIETRTLSTALMTFTAPTN